MKLADAHNRLSPEIAVAAGLATAGMQLVKRCIATAWSNVTQPIGMRDTRFKGT
jgi:hypothetical protein